MIMDLVLSDLHIGLYDRNMACAYIYYGSKEQPLDNLGKPISTFYQQPNKFADHLASYVLPILNKTMAMSNYRAVTVDFVNQAPHPFIVICKNDSSQISYNDLQHICVLIDRALDEHNKKVHQEKNSKRPTHHSHDHEKIDNVVNKFLTKKEYASVRQAHSFYKDVTKKAKKSYDRHVIKPFSPR